MRVHGGTDHRPGDHRPLGFGRRGRRSQLLADGLQEAPEDERSPAPSARVPQSPVCAPRHAVGANEGLLEEEEEDARERRKKRRDSAEEKRR